MNEDPTYEYIKGQGWVPCIHETVTKVIGRYKVTLIKRLPELGETGLSLTDPEKPLTVELDRWTERLLYNVDGKIGWDCNASNYEYTRSRPNEHKYWVTCIVEVLP